MTIETVVQNLIVTDSCTRLSYFDFFEELRRNSLRKVTYRETIMLSDCTVEVISKSDCILSLSQSGNVCGMYFEIAGNDNICLEVRITSQVQY